MAAPRSAPTAAPCQSWEPSSNAIKFTDRGTVHLRLLQNVPSAGETEISVEDTGIGIAEEDQAKLFGAFVRFAGGRPGAAGGTGLGLHLSRNLAALLGGRIEMRSESGTGSRFALVLPGA